VSNAQRPTTSFVSTVHQDTTSTTLNVMPNVHLKPTSLAPPLQPHVQTAIPLVKLVLAIQRNVSLVTRQVPIHTN
jgi:hypothetical protein